MLSKYILTAYYHYKGEDQNKTYMLLYQNGNNKNHLVKLLEKNIVSFAEFGSVIST